ncbi:MAG: GNAT family N-acetyltransferase [Candidatus Hodarchaeota archaeon]
MNDSASFAVERIRKGWAEYFNCSPSDLDSPGTRIIPSRDFADSRMAIIWHIGKMAFVQIDPDFSESFSEFIEEIQDSMSISAADVCSSFCNWQITLDHTDYIYYLSPNEFVPFTPEREYIVRQLSMKDKNLLDTLHSACPFDEVDNAYVHIDHELAFGAFFEQTLVAAASVYDWRGITGDVGVLTHPGFRRKGLGKSVVSAICEREIANDRIVQYRAHVELISSWKIPEALGFKRYFKEETLLFS